MMLYRHKTPTRHKGVGTYKVCNSLESYFEACTSILYHQMPFLRKAPSTPSYRYEGVISIFDEYYRSRVPCSYEDVKPMLDEYRRFIKNQRQKEDK